MYKKLKAHLASAQVYGACSMIASRQGIFYPEQFQTKTAPLLYRMGYSRNTVKTYLDYAVERVLVHRTAGSTRQQGWLYRPYAPSDPTILYYGIVESSWLEYRIDCHNRRPNIAEFSYVLANRLKGVLEFDDDERPNNGQIPTLLYERNRVRLFFTDNTGQKPRLTRSAQ